MVRKLSQVGNWLLSGFPEFVQLFGFHVIYDQPPSVFILATEGVGCERTLLEKFSLKTWCCIYKSYFVSTSREQNKCQKMWVLLLFHFSALRLFWSFVVFISFPVFRHLPYPSSPLMSIYSSSSPHPFTCFVQSSGLLVCNPFKPECWVCYCLIFFFFFRAIFPI